MFGDLILNCRILVKQFFCIHDYKYTKRELIGQTFHVTECKKCGRVIVK